MVEFDNRQVERFDEIFKLSHRDKELFTDAHQSHYRFQAQCGVPLAALPARSYFNHTKIGDREIRVVAFSRYGEDGLDLCERALTELEGQRISEILFLIERPLRVIVRDCANTCVEQIAHKIASRAGLEITNMESSPSSVSVVQRAADIGETQHIPLSHILGAIVYDSAFSINLGLDCDFTAGIDEVYNLLEGQQDIISLYRALKMSLACENWQVQALGAAIDRAAIAANLTNTHGEPEPGCLFTKNGLQEILSRLSDQREEVLGFTATSASPPLRCQDNVSALIACYEAWGRSFPSLDMHNGTLEIAELRQAAYQGDSVARSYLQNIHACVQTARLEATEECFNALALESSSYKQIVYIAEAVVAVPSLDILKSKFP